MMADMIVTPPPGGFKTGDYRIRRYGTGSLDASGAYVAGADVNLAATSVDDTTDELAIAAHGLVTGRGPLYVEMGDPTVETLPTPLVAGTPYWAIAVDADHVKLAVTSSDALNEVAVDLTDIGVGAPRLSNGFVVAGSVQQLGSSGDGELADDQQGQRTRDVRKLFTVAPLFSRTASQDPDIVELDGNHFRVNSSKRYGTLSGGHSISMIEKIEVP